MSDRRARLDPSEVLTAITLWSLGQNLVFATEPERSLPAIVLQQER